MRLTSLMLLLFALTVCTAAPPEDAVKQEVEKLQGSWKAVAVEDAGKKRPDDHIKNWMLIVKDDKMTARDGDETLDESTFKLDPSKKPTAIEIVYTSGEDKGKVLRGICSVEGDTLKICVAFTEKQVPTEFTTREGTDQTLVVLQRDKSGKNAPTGK